MSRRVATLSGPVRLAPRRRAGSPEWRAPWRHAATQVLAALLVVVAALTGLDAVALAAPDTVAVTAVWTEPTAGYGFLDAAIGSAHTSIDLSMYELSDATIVRALVERAHAGVAVRVILNAAYDGASKNAAAAEALRAGSVEVVWAPSDQIFHAKYLVVDDDAVYVGTGNLVAADYDSTRDFWVKVTTPADVRAVVSTFDADFVGSGAPARPAPGLVWSPGSASALVELIASARHSLLVENEEMDSAEIEDALVGATRRGVSVAVVMSEASSWTRALARLTRAGVHVHQLSDRQVYIHAKVLCVDCTANTGTVFIGSENFSTASLSYDRELGVVTESPAAVHAVEHAVRADYVLGAPVTTPSPAPTSAADSHVTITSVVATVARGSRESLDARTSEPGVTCTLTVVLPGGDVSEARGLGAQSSSAEGYLRWTWEVGATTDPGVARATVACGGASASRTFTITA